MLHPRAAFWGGHLKPHKLLVQVSSSDPACLSAATWIVEQQLKSSRVRQFPYNRSCREHGAHCARGIRGPVSSSNLTTAPGHFFANSTTLRSPAMFSQTTLAIAGWRSSAKSLKNHGLQFGSFLRKLLISRRRADLSGVATAISQAGAKRAPRVRN